jgi:phage baseplate assembly protein W
MATTNIYKDIPTNFQAHPVKGDISLLLDSEAIKRSLRNLILTDPGEKLFRPYLGTGIKASLFENFGPDTQYILKSTIEEIIRNNERRVDVLDVIVNATPDQNGYNIKIIFSINNSVQPVTLEMILGRVR